MEQRNKKVTERDPLVNNMAIFIGMILICALSLYVPMLIFALLFLIPLALKQDMESNKPIFSFGLIALTGLFVYVSGVSYALYIILVLCTGFSVLINYFICKFVKVKTFTDGVMYSIAFSVMAGLMAALIIFLLRDRQSFAEELVIALENWILESKSYFVDTAVSSFYNVNHLRNSEEVESLAVVMDVYLGVIDYGSDLSKAQKLDAIMPDIQNAVNIYAIFAMLIYPAFAGVMTWWRGNFRYYKDQPMTKEDSQLKPKPFSTFTIPRRLFLVVVLLLFGSIFMQTPGSSDVILYAANAIQSFASLLLAIQGFAVMEYFMKRSRVLKYGALRAILMFMITFISAGFIPIFFGAVDLMINVRLVYTKTQEMKAKIQQAQMKKEEENKDQDENKN